MKKNIAMFLGARFILVLVLGLIFAMPYIYPETACWDDILCEMYTPSIPSSPVTEVCTIENISTAGSQTEVILIEVIQGGANSDRDYSFIANRDSISHIKKVYFEMSEETTPTYILCHAYDVALSATGGYEVGKVGLIDFWMSTSTSTERDYNKAIIIDFNAVKEYDEVLDDNNISKYVFGIILALIAIAIIYFSVYEIIKGRKGR